MRSLLAGAAFAAAIVFAAPAAAQDTDTSSTTTTTTIQLSAPSTSILVEPPATTIDLSAPTTSIATAVEGVQEVNAPEAAPALAHTGANLNLLLLGLALVVGGATCVAFVAVDARATR